MRIPFRQHIIWCLVAVMFILGVTPGVDAGIVPSELIALSNVDRESAIEKIQKFLETKMIRERLDNFGLTQDEIQTRLSRFSDQQIHQLAIQIDDLKVGGDGADVIIALLLIAILVVLLLQLTGHRVIVTK